MSATKSPWGNSRWDRILSLLVTKSIMNGKNQEPRTDRKDHGPDRMRVGLMDELTQIIGDTWREKSGQEASTPDKELEALLNALREARFRFSPMYRSWIPKPNKPGEVRPITQPATCDRIVMDSISYLLNKTYGSIFLGTSHGFRKGRGPITFFSEFHKWGPLDRLVKSDVVKCFDNIDHELLTSFLVSDLGQGNQPLCDLINGFLKTEIRDKQGNDYSNKERGIPQGSSLSPVLMNIFLHRIDKDISKLMEIEGSLRYARYADDMIFGFTRGPDSEGAYRRFRIVFVQSLESLKLRESSIELLRGYPQKTRVLGLVVFLGNGGTPETRAPFRRWKKKLTLAYINSKIPPRKRVTLLSFIRTLIPLIKTRIAFCFCCSYLYGEQELIEYFTHLLQTRVKEFQKGKRYDPHKEREVSFLTGKIPFFVNYYKRRMQQKARSRPVKKVSKKAQ